MSLAIQSKREKVVELLKKAGAIDVRPPGAADSDAEAAPGFTMPVALNRPAPGYTTKARQKMVQGVVRLRVLVAADGTVKKAQVITGLPDGLSYQAVAAASEINSSPLRKKDSRSRIGSGSL